MQNIIKTGSYVVAITNNCENLTVGKTYKVLEAGIGSLGDQGRVLELENDLGRRGFYYSSRFLAFELYEELTGKTVQTQVNPDPKEAMEEYHKDLKEVRENHPDAKLQLGHIYIMRKGYYNAGAVVICMKEKDFRLSECPMIGLKGGEKYGKNPKLWIHAATSTDEWYAAGGTSHLEKTVGKVKLPT